MLYIFLILVAGCLVVFCMYQAAVLNYITLFNIRDTLYIMELQVLAGTPSSREDLDRARMDVRMLSRKCALYYTAAFLLLFLILLFFFGLLIQKL